MKSNTALDVESKALVETENEKNAAIVEVKSPDYKDEAKLHRGSAWKQVLAAFIANLGTINTGLVFGFSAVAIPQLEEPTSFIKVDEEQASWIASLSSLTTPIGCLVSGYLMDIIGRKRTLIITEVPLILGWLLISFSSCVEMIYVGRLLVGLGSGMVGAPARVYTGEVTQPHLRGMLSALASVGVSLGVLIEYALGAIATWTVLAGISAAIPILALLLITLMPETPNWLLTHGYPREAKAALRKFRGPTCDVEKEMSDLESFSVRNNVVQLKGFKETLHALISPAALKPFGILVAYFGIYQFSGINSVTFYAVQVFKESGTEMNKYLATVILGVVRLLSTIVACISLRRCGRRPLTMISGIGCGVTMVGLGSYMYLRTTWIKSGVEPVATWIPVACIFIFTIACTLGYLVVPWVMIGEVYPTQVLDEAPKKSPDDGCCIWGLFMEGARWSAGKKLLIESRPKELYTDMPVVWMLPEENRVAPTVGIYECPVYKTLTRAGTLSTTGHSTNYVVAIEIPSDKPQTHWIKRGVALICALNY